MALGRNVRKLLENLLENLKWDYEGGRVDCVHAGLKYVSFSVTGGKDAHDYFTNLLNNTCQTLNLMATKVASQVIGDSRSHYNEYSKYLIEPERERASGLDYMGMITHIKNRGTSYESVVFNESDPLGMMIHLTPSGNLVDCWGKSLPKSTTFWGYIVFIDMKPHRIKFE